MRDLKEYDYRSLLLNLSTTSLNKAQRRWRIAYATIYSVRAMLSLVKEIVPGRIDPKSSDASSYTALESGDGEKINSMPLSYVPDIDQERLVEIMKGKDLQGIRALGGVEGIAASLKTNATKGIHGNEQEVNRRRDLFGSNTYHKPPPKGLLFFVYDAFKDTTILILLACAILSLGFGIKEHGLKEGWYEGGSIFIAVFLVIVVSALSNFRQERQFDKLSKISNNIKVEVLRDSRRQHISIFDVVVGDVVFLKIGDQIPADGLFLDGHSLQVDESSMTGESDHLEVDHKDNPFLFSGTKIVDGFAQMLVVSVGMSTTWGQTMSSINQDSSERTPLQVRLDTLTSTIGKLGLTVAALVLVVLLVRYFTGNTKKDGKIEYNGSKTPVDTIVNSVVRIVSVAVTIVVVAIPEGLPLAVTLTLAYSMKRMMSDQAMVRKLSACETMGSATVICTDKTGTLTLNEMKVTKFWLGQESIHEDSTQMISSDVLDLLYQGTGLNTTGSVCVSDSGPTPEFSGSPTEKALLSWTVLNLGMDMESMKQKYDVLHVETFNSAKKRSGVLVRRKSDNTVHVHWKGAAEMVLAMCSHYYTSTGSVDLMDSTAQNRIQAIIQGLCFPRQGDSSRRIDPKSSDASSYTALESGDGAMINSMPLSYVPDIDQERLVEIMKGKDLPAFGWVEWRVSPLPSGQTPPKESTGMSKRSTDAVTYLALTPTTSHRLKDFFFVYDAFKDTTILILLACAALSLGFGIKEHGLQEGWYEGGSIFVAVFLVIVVSALSNFRQERQFDKLSKISNNIKVEVLRDSSVNISPSSMSLLVDESSMTGESDHLEVDHKDNPFLFSGTKIVDGFAKMLVLSVGMSTTWGQTMSSINQDSSERTPLQVRLDTLTSTIGKLGLTVAALVLVVLLVRYFTGNTKKDGKIEYNGSKTPVDSVVNSVVTKFWLGQESIHEDSTQMISSDVLDLLYQGTGLNTTGSVCVSDSGPTPEFSGSPTEKALLSWIVLNLGMDMESVKQKYNVLRVETFNSAKKRSGVLVRRKSDNTVHVHWKGAAEMVLAMCSHYYTSTGSVDLMDSTAQNRVQAIIQGMAASSLRCIAFAHKVSLNNSGLEEDGLTLMGIVAIAFECGILDHNDKDEEEAVVEGVQFRNYTDEERMQKVEKIRVMARSSPSDKLLMVKCLRLKGHVVAVTGDADIGLSMGIQGTEVAKESSDIVILDDNFTSVATVLKWGRCVYNNIQKFIQFQLTVNVAALVINFIAAVSAGEVPLTAVQLLWVNLIMDTLGALALATERPTNELLKRKPVGRTEPLITNVMWRNLLVQSLYQIAVLLILQFKGMSIFNVRKEVKDTLIFNTFVLCQVFNEFNAREMEKKNVFKGIHRNRLFVGIIAITIFADTVRLNGWQWGTCIAIASLSWPIGFFTKFIPVSETPFLSYFKNPRSLFKGSRSLSPKKP
ncbi:hypothetical protein Bca52824_008062 [Brassica carinata]|uniref:P-type Ca(2+) transporter n=1 Tax=Brassica carinata TaxID=52824 RepID=A0A8X7W7E5_BRACI|nr:hypothetical protein Bca52824_008062 [Brassica carinata]